jgi:hypothetical protein
MAGKRIYYPPISRASLRIQLGFGPDHRQSASVAEPGRRPVLEAEPAARVERRSTRCYSHRRTPAGLQQECVAHHQFRTACRLLKGEARVNPTDVNAWPV